VQPYPQGGLFGMDTVTFSTQVMPALQARDDVVVRVKGEPPAYQEADEAPMVHLTTVDDEEQPNGDWFDLHVSVSVDGQQVPFGPLFTALAATRR